MANKKNELFLAKEDSTDSTNTPAYNESVIKEQVYTEERDQAQADINEIKAEEQVKQEKPVSKNIFRRMKEAFERNQVDRELERHEKEQIKKDYEVKISEARKARKMADIDQKYKDKLAYESLTREEKMGRIKERATAFGNKLAAGMGSGTSGTSSGNNMFSAEKMDRLLGKQSSGNQQSTSGDIFSPDKVSRMLGSTSFGTQRQQGGDMFSTDKISNYLGTKRTASQSNPAAQFGKTNTSGKNIPQYLGKTNVSGKKPSDYFGKTGTGVNMNKYLGQGAGVDMSKFLGKMPGTPQPQVKGKPKIIDVTPQKESSEAKIRRMLGKI